MNKFIILTGGRTGSTYFRLWLNSHPNIRCHGEIFSSTYNAMDGFRFFCSSNFFRNSVYKIFYSNKFCRLLPIGLFIPSFFSSLYHNPQHSGPWTDMNSWNEYQERKYVIEKAVGFKLSYRQLEDLSCLKRWIKNEQILIIHLVRTNVLQIHLSWLGVKKRNLYHSYIEINNEKLLVDTNNLIKTLDRIKQERMKIIEQFKHNSIIEIEYEDFFKNISKVSADVFNYLNVKHCSLQQPELKKLNRGSTNNIIQNFEEVKKVISGTEFERYLV